MKRKSKVLLAIASAIIVVVLALGVQAYREFFGGAVQFDSDFYKEEPADADFVFSYDQYDTVLANYADEDGMVNYAELKMNRGDLDAFARALGRLDAATYESWSDDAKVAFWINAYNALTLKIIIDHYPIQPGSISSYVYPDSSIQQIPGVWEKFQFLLVGERLTLNQIEHEILRQEFDEPRIHVALVCAAMGCPRLRNEPYVEERLHRQLDQDARNFFADPGRLRIDRTGAKVYFSSIFEWFGSDFVDKYSPPDGFVGHDEPERAALNFAGMYLPPDDDAYLRDGAYEVEYVDYDWSLNEQKKVTERQD